MIGSLSFKSHPCSRAESRNTGHSNKNAQNCRTADLFRGIISFQALESFSTIVFTNTKALSVSYKTAVYSLKLFFPTKAQSDRQALIEKSKKVCLRLIWPEHIFGSSRTGPSGHHTRLLGGVGSRHCLHGEKCRQQGLSFHTTML